MRIEEKVLRRMDFSGERSPDVMVFVRDVIRAYNAEREARGTSGRGSSLPTRFVEVGERITLGRRVFVCVEAPRRTCVCEACGGCDLSRLYLNCGDLQCGKFDRRDGRFVWFREVEESLTKQEEGC